MSARPDQWLGDFMPRIEQKSRRRNRNQPDSSCNVLANCDQIDFCYRLQLSDGQISNVAASSRSVQSLECRITSSRLWTANRQSEPARQLVMARLHDRHSMQCHLQWCTEHQLASLNILCTNSRMKTKLTMCSLFIYFPDISTVSSGPSSTKCSITFVRCLLATSIN